MSATLETFGDKARAFALALGVHVLCVLLVFIGLALTPKIEPVSVAGPVIEATLVNLAAPPKPTVPKPRPVRPPPPPKPEPAPVEPEIAPPVPPRAEDTVDQEEVDLLGIDPSELEREQEERRKREQELLEEQERLAMLQQERERQLEDIRRQREEAQKQRELEEQRLAEMQEEEERREREAQEAVAEESPDEGQPMPGNEGVDDDLLGRYALAIQTAVTQAWLRPDNVQQVVCTVRIAQIPGGEVISATVVSPCNADDLTRRSLEAAVMRAQPLPYQGYESVFQRNINFNFCYPRDLCRG